jgi:zinc transport system ATP-binding protein
MEAEPVIDLRDVGFAYNDRLILDSVDLVVKAMDFTSIVGPNGGGKTTLLKLICGLLKPRSGSIEVLGQTPREARTRIGYMPQSAQLDPLFPITVREVVLTGRLSSHRWFGRYSNEDRRIADESLAEVGLSDASDNPFFSLSGGQRQRVLIGRALATQPDILLLDEPTANFDPKAEQSFYKLLRDLNKRLTIVLVSHDLNFVSTFVKTVICVHDGKAVAHPTSEIPGELASDVLGRGTMRLVSHDHALNTGRGS